MQETPGGVPSQLAGSAGNPTATSAPVPTQTPDPNPTALPEPAQRTTYHIQAVLDFENGSLSVDQRIEYLNDTGQPLNTLVLVVEPSRLADHFELESAVWATTRERVEISAIEAGIAHINLPEPLDPGALLGLVMAYSYDLPRRPGKLSFFNNQVHLGDWYPHIPPFRPRDGWLAYRPNPVGETLIYDLADFEVELAVHSAPPGLLVAAPVSPIEEAVQEAGFDARDQASGYRNFALSLSPDYVQQEIQAGDVTLYGYALPITGPSGEAALAAAASALEVYQELFRPYPHSTFTLVSGNFPDGLEFDGLAFLSQDYHFWYPGGIRDYLPLLAAHEVAHQWWLAGVGSDQAIEPWLDEALSIYSELLWLEQAHPDLVDWWWEFRVASFEPLEGFVNDTVYQYGSFRPYVNAIYLRGAEMMRALRVEMGDEAFFAALQDYAGTFWEGEATGEDFITLMEAHHGGSLDSVWSIYFRP